FSTPMICSSVKRFRFMGLPPSSIQRWKTPVRNGPDIGGKVKVLCGSQQAEVVLRGRPEKQLEIRASSRNHLNLWREVAKIERPDLVPHLTL
ncbi:MAG: hypothetical protein AAGE03_12695, partial [Pseudomonadota bacterium]